LINNITHKSLLYGGDIGLSSIDMFNVIVIVEEQYNIEFPDEMMKGVLTITILE
jgi:acyl carrier protein